MTLNSGVGLSTALGILSLVALVIAQLALADVFHGEPDLSLEWRALQLCALVILVTQVFTRRTLWRVMRGQRGREGA